MTTRTVRVAFALAAVCASVSLAYAANPTFWQVSTEAEFAKGDVENLSIDGYGRLTLGPTTTSIYDASAPFLWTMISGARRLDVRRQRQRRPGLPHRRRAAKARSSSMPRSSRSTRWRLRQAAASTSAHLRTARSTRSTPRASRPCSSIRPTSTSGAWRSTRRATSSPQPATKASSTRSRRTERARRLLPDQGHARDVAGLRKRRAVCSPAPSRRDASSSIDANGKPFVLLDSPLQRDPHAARSIRRGHLRRGGRAGRGGRAAEHCGVDPGRRRRHATATVSVSTEITAIAIVDSAPAGGGADVGTARAPASDQSRRARSIRITPDGASDLIWESREDSPYDIAFEPDGSAARRHGQQGQDLSPVRRPASADAGDPRQRAAGDDARSATATAGSSSPPRTPASLPALARRAPSAAPTPPTCATRRPSPRGARCVAGGRARRAHGRDLDALGQHAHAGRDLERLDAAHTRRGRQRDHQPTRPLPAVARGLTGSRGEAPLLTSVTAAYLPRNLRPRVTSITIHPPGTVFQRPFPTGIRRSPASTATRPIARNAPQPREPRPAPNVGRRGYQKGLLTFVWRAEDDNRDDLSTTCSIGAKARRRGSR